MFLRPNVEADQGFQTMLRKAGSVIDCCLMRLMRFLELVASQYLHVILGFVASQHQHVILECVVCQHWYVILGITVVFHRFRVYVLV